MELLDSWEADCANWTPEMASEFEKRRGYDPVPWLPAFSGKIIGSAELTQRFLWDFRRTQADLLAENHYGVIQKYAHDHHMGVVAEASGIGMPTVADQLLCKKFTDIPMGEFWLHGNRDSIINDPKEAASAAHIYGQNLAAAEAFTASPECAAWKNDPYSLKARGDQEFCLGINRFVFHRYAHQPWLDRQPGMSMGPFGINFERTNTWWKPGTAWISYLSRCQYLLQQGRFQADLCYFYGEGAPIGVNHSLLKPSVPRGYDYDVCNADVLLHLMNVKDGRLSLTSGMRYRVLVLPETDRMTLPVLQKIAQLVQAGATVYGPKPRLSPSLTNYPESDKELTKLANEVWGSCDGKTVTEHAYGQGKIVWGEPLEKALAVQADFAAVKGDVLYIHRQDGPADIYFVSSQEQKPITAECTFRVTGKTPELWHPDTGVCETVALYRTENGRTTLPIHFDPVGSVFVIFRHDATNSPSLVSGQIDGKRLFADGDDQSAELPVLSKGQIKLTVLKEGAYEFQTITGETCKTKIAPLPEPVELNGSWKVTFPPKLGAPESATFDRLISWSDSPTDGIKYFSGTATYEKDFTLPQASLDRGHRAYLDLGSVKNLAQVSLNGKALGILWKEPFRVEITEAAKPGVNHLSVKITNLWPNRLIGDQKLPETQRVTWTSVSLYTGDSPLLPSGLLGPVTMRSAQTITIGNTP
ncbi:MAG: glycosyl hydrolase [Chthoniobacteraceae bacterium]